MKAVDLATMEMDELAEKLRDSRRELYELRFKLAVGQLDDHRQIRNVKHDIARIMTFMRQRQLGVAASQAVAVGEPPPAGKGGDTAKAAEPEPEATEAAEAAEETQPDE
jgi:large subunit ribosomal protein L29